MTGPCTPSGTDLARSGTKKGCILMQPFKNFWWAIGDLNTEPTD